MSKYKKVVFANKKLEDDYTRVAHSKHPEDKKLYLFLKQVRSTLQKRYPVGKAVPENEIPVIYRRMFHIDNLWRLELLDHGTILYSFVGDEIRIVDIL